MIFCEHCGAEIKDNNFRFDEKNWHPACYERMKEAKKWEIPIMCAHCGFQIVKRDSVLKYIVNYYGNSYHAACEEEMKKKKGDK